MSENNKRGNYGQVKYRSWGEVLSVGLHKESIQDEVDSMTIIKPFSIKECDLKTIKRFVTYCRLNSKNDWGLGLKQLLDVNETDAKTMMMYEKIVELEKKVASLSPVKEQDTKPKTLGGGDEE